MPSKEARISILTYLQKLGLIISTLSALIGAIYGALAYLDLRIEKKLSDPAVIKHIAESIRPSLIFNERGIIEYDSGASELIDNIQTNVSDGLAQEVTIKTKKWLSRAPLIFILGPYTQTQTKCERSGNYAWTYKFEYVVGGDLEKHPELLKGSSYRLEILY